MRVFFMFNSTICQNCPVQKWTKFQCFDGQKACKLCSDELLINEELSDSYKSLQQRSQSSFKKDFDFLKQLNANYAFNFFTFLSPTQKIYRGRRFSNWINLKKALENPSQNFGLAPRNISQKNRFNQAGDPVFYGSFSVSTVIKEIFPFANDYVAIFRFNTIRPFSVLDLTPLYSPQNWTKVHNDDLKKLMTIYSDFSYLFRPISHDLKDVCYNLSNAFSDFIREKNIDGLLYPSSVSSGTNIVLFSDRVDFSSDSSYNVGYQFAISDKQHLCLTAKKHCVRIDEKSLKIFQIENVNSSYKKRKMIIQFN